MSMNDDNIHWLPFDSYNEFNEFENSSNELEDDDSVEVMSNIDAEENNIIDMTKNLIVSSDDELQNNDQNHDIHYVLANTNNDGFPRGVSDNIRSSHGDIDLKSDANASDDSVESYSLNLSIPSHSSLMSQTILALFACLLINY